MTAALPSVVRLELPKLLPGQQQMDREARRFSVAVIGRRGGKSTFLVDRLVHPALQGYQVAAFSPTYKMLTEFWREVIQALHPVISRTNAQEHRLELVTGGVVDMWSLTDPNMARGRKYKRVVVDEAAMAPALQEAWEAVIRPTLADYQGDAWFGSTPKGLNYFYTLYEWGQDPLREDWVSWQMPTSSNPLINPDEIEDARKELPQDTFEQEYLAEFKQNAGSVFRRVAENLTAEPATPDKHFNHPTVMGVDLAQSEDFTVLSVGCAKCKCEVDLDRFNELDWAIQRDRILQMMGKWQCADVLIERNSIGGPNLEALSERTQKVRGFETTFQSKGPLIRSLALAFERTEFKWLPDAVAKNELLAYEVKVNPITGRPTYSAPEGKHDDTVIARALMFKAATEGGPVFGEAAAEVFARAW